VFFFEKKNQKTFTYCGRFRGVRDSTGKSFLLLFFKKEDPPLLRAPFKTWHGESDGVRF
jgi:hypothetical protein